MPISVDNIIANPGYYKNHYNDYSPNNAYYNYYDEYRKHAHRYEQDYEEKRAAEEEQERRELEELRQSYQKISLEEMETQIHDAWEKQLSAGKTSPRDLFFTTDITDLDKYVEKYRKTKEAQGIDNCMNPLTRAEEKALWEKWRSTPNNIQMSSYDFIHKGYPSLDDNMVFWIEGVRFSKEEYEQCRSVIDQASKLIPGGSLDYMDHALLGIVYNVVNTYAEENLTWEQQQVVSQSMMANLDTYSLMEQEYFKGRDDIVRNNDKFHNIQNKETGGCWVTATNDELIQALRTMFGEVNLRDQKAVDKIFGQYLTIAGIAGSFRDENRLKVGLSNAKSILNNAGKKVDYSI